MSVRFTSFGARTLVYKRLPKSDGKRSGVRFYTDLINQRKIRVERAGH